MTRLRTLAFSLAAALVMASGPSGYAAPPAATSSSKVTPEAKRITGSENYVATFGLRASISRGFQVEGVLAVDAGLDIPNPKVRKQADALRPRVMSAMRDAVLSYASLSYVVGDRPDADLLRARLQRAVDGVLGKGEATVALASVMVLH